MDATQALAYERRSGITTIRGRRFRISEPRPRVASVILTHLGKMISPWVVQLMSGQVILNKPSVCPQCGAEGRAERVNGGRWLCQEPVVDASESRPCGTLWPRERMVDDDGEPVHLTLPMAMRDRAWRALTAIKIGESLDALDPDDAHDLAMRMIFAGTEWDPLGSGQWLPIDTPDTLDKALAQARIGGAGVMRLAKAHLEVWALPSLVDDWTDTSPASSTSATPGGSVTPGPEPQASAPGGRVPPRTQRRTG